jgi:hypothetical protein
VLYRLSYVGQATPPILPGRRVQKAAWERLGHGGATPSFVVDEKLGVAPNARDAEMADLRVQVAEMRDEMAQLRAEVVGRNGAPSEELDLPSVSGR